MSSSPSFTPTGCEAVSREPELLKPQYFHLYEGNNTSSLRLLVRIKGNSETDVQVSLDPGKVLSEGSLSFCLLSMTHRRLGICSWESLSQAKT